MFDAGILMCAYFGVIPILRHVLAHKKTADKTIKPEADADHCIAEGAKILVRNT
jgi:hypothetical protein